MKDAIYKFSLQLQDMQWLSVCISIPAVWKSKLNENNISWPTPQGNCTQLHHLTVKSVYKKQLKSLIKTPTSQKVFEMLLNFSGINWATIYMIPQKVTIESSSHIFQYQLLNNAIFLNDRLSEFDPSISPLCSLCQQSPYNVLHFFCECRKTQALWHALCDAMSPHITLPTLCPIIAILGEWNKFGRK